MVTVLQEEQIRQLRSQGVGYRNIANRLHLTRDAVRNYCRANNLNGYREAVQMNIQMMQSDDSVCNYCGKSLIQPKTGRKKRFCSEKCRRKWWNQNRDKIRENPNAIYTFICKGCGKEFTAYGNKTRQYCSHDCYISSRFWNGEKPEATEEVDVDNVTPEVTRIE